MCREVAVSVAARPGCAERLPEYLATRRRRSLSGENGLYVFSGAEHMEFDAD